MVAAYEAQGWARFPYDPALARWVSAALPFAQAALVDPAMAQWHVCEGTWFVGVDALPNDKDGAVGESGPLQGAVRDFLNTHYGAIPPLHQAQVSVTWPGYPRPRDGESEAAFRYRQKRDAAHVD